MTQQEMKKLRVIDQTITKSITVREAAGLLNLSERQVYRLKKGVIAFLDHSLPCLIGMMRAYHEFIVK
jgi:DNA-directed RNA polymerase specialized sigma subunit